MYSGGMHAMQYEITLPADYDMGIIRERVASKGALLDGWPGLGLKAYCVRERAEGSPVNQYSPFYLWRTVEGMNAFLWGDGFRGLCESFGRPVVQQWTALAFLRGPAWEGRPTRASKVTSRITPEGIPDAVTELRAEDRSAFRRAGGRHEGLGARPVHAVRGQPGRRVHGSAPVHARAGPAAGRSALVIRTVLGDVDELGVTNSHDHLFLAS